MDNGKGGAAGGGRVRTALVMEGGAMRGLFTCGVIDVLLDNGIRFDGAAGISAGAVFGCNFKSRQAGRPVRYNKKYCADPRFCSLRNLIRTGDLYGADFCYREIPDVLDPFDTQTFRDDPTEFYVGATDVSTGRCVYHKCTDGGEEDIAWMRASASMPLVSRPVRAGGRLLLDGGISDAVPFAFMERSGFRRNLIVLTQPRGYRKRRSRAVPLVRLLLRRYPAVAEAMAVRHEMYNRQMEQIEERERRGDCFVIRPPESLGIGRTEKDPDRLEQVYRTGRAAAERALPGLERFLASPEAEKPLKNRRG